MDLIQETIDHYDRMIEWASTQPSSDSVSLDKMEAGLGETWTSRDCPMCQSTPEDSCVGCPIYEDGHYYCRDTGWSKLNRALTWNEWIKHAYCVRDYICSLHI